MRVTVEGNQIPRADARFERQMKPVNGVKKKQRPDAFVEIFAPVAEGFKFGALREQFRQRGRAAKRIQGLIAHRRVRRGDDGYEFAGHDLSFAKVSRHF
jgi:hypothetical protein